MTYRPARILLILSAFAGVPAPAQTTAPAVTNPVSNPGFESDLAGWSLQDSAASASAAIDPAVSHAGHKSLRISNATAFAPNVWYRAAQTVHVQPFTTYRFGCWVKGDAAGDNFIGGGPGWAIRLPLPAGTFDWTHVSQEWTAGESPDDFELMLLTQSATKAVWIDDVEFTPIRTDTAKLAALQARLDADLAQRRDHLAKTTALAQRLGLSSDPYVALGLSVTTHFLTRIQSPATHQNIAWSNFQLEEIDTVLSATDDRLNQLPKSLPGLSPLTTINPPTIRDGLLYPTPDRAAFYLGYGAFGTVVKTVPEFPAMGINLIQDSCYGPSSLTPAGEFPNAPALAADFANAARAHVNVDFLLSPHYFPDFAYEKSPDLRNNNIGFLDYNVDHPTAADVLNKWVRAALPPIKGSPSFFSVCLSNEPAYVRSGKDPYSRPAFAAYLRDTHKTIAALNALYSTDYKSFDDVPPPDLVGPAPLKNLPLARAYYDWSRFNQINFANWHHRLSDAVHAIAPAAKTHVKTLIPFALLRENTNQGVDPELMCQFTDLAGCDTVTSWSNTTLTAWQEDEFYYDLLHSFRGQPVFNSETHLIPDGFPAQHIPMENTRAALWQAMLHHLSAATLWVWEEPGPGGLDGSVFLRPASAFAVGRACLDANRLAPELAAINEQPARVALLYSRPSLFWDPKYYPTLRSLYSQLRMSGHKVTFVSELQLAANHAPDVKVILSAHATHVSDPTVQALSALQTQGRKLLLCGKDDLSFDEYHRPRRLPASLAAAPHVDLGPDAAKQHHDLVSSLQAAGLLCIQLHDAAQAVANGIEYRLVPYADATLIPLINLTATAQTIRLPNSPGPTIDLLTGQPVDPAAVQLNPMVPVLLRAALPNSR